MKKVTLVFPDTSGMADFLLIYWINGVGANTSDLLVTGVISNQQITWLSAEYRFL